MYIEKLRALTSILLKSRKISSNVTKIWYIVLELISWNKSLNFKKVLWNLKKSFFSKLDRFKWKFTTCTYAIETSNQLTLTLSVPSWM